MVSCFNRGLNTHYVILKISRTKNAGSKCAVIFVLVQFHVPKLHAFDIPAVFNLLPLIGKWFTCMPISVAARSMPAAAWLLQQRVRSPLCSSLVRVVCCVGTGLCDGLITRSEKYCGECVSNCVCVCVLETSKRGCRATEQSLTVFTQSQKVNAVWHYVS